MVTQKQIAEKLGVSRQLVGFALNGGGTVSEKMRREILAAAEEMGYRPNEVARAMVTGRQRVIGFLALDPEHFFTAKLIAGALDGATQKEYALQIVRLGDPETDRAVVQRCADLRLAGVVAMHAPPARMQAICEELGRYEIPLALTTTFPFAGAVRVALDEAQGAIMAVEHLVSLGHRKIAHLSSAPDDPWALRREEGYRCALGRHGLPVPEGYVHFTHMDAARAHAALRTLLRHPEGRPTAVFCSDDRIALQLFRAARLEGLDVPRDLSVVGYSNLDVAEFSDPPLTTVEKPLAEMARVATRRLIERLEKTDSASGGPAEGLVEYLSPRLIVRESTTSRVAEGE